MNIYLLACVNMQVERGDGLTGCHLHSCLWINYCKTGCVFDNLTIYIIHLVSRQQNHRKISGIIYFAEQRALVVVLLKYKSNYPLFSLLVHLEI